MTGSELQPPYQITGKLFRMEKKIQHMPFFICWMNYNLRWSHGYHSGHEFLSLTLQATLACMLKPQGQQRIIWLSLCTLEGCLRYVSRIANSIWQISLWNWEEPLPQFQTWLGGLLFKRTVFVCAVKGVFGLQLCGIRLVTTLAMPWIFKVSCLIKSARKF